MQSGILLNQRYEIADLIAEGGMARVFRAQDRRLDRTVAIKILREQYASDDAFLTRFQQEARAAAALSHPNIVNVYDVGAEGGVNYIVMELVDGPNLKQVIERDGSLSPARVLELTQETLSALSFAHHHGIVHRDVKPQNILLSSHGHAKVTDFGIARASSASQLTETGLVMGSVHYCAPEQAMGKGSSEASDVYSVGVVLFEMLTGQLPFESDNALGVALKHVQESPPSLRQLNPRLSPALENIVNKALAKEPGARYANADEMLQTIQSYRRLGEQGTAPFAAVTAGAVGPNPTRSATRVAQQAEKSVAQKKRRTGDWLVVLLSILILGMIAGWIPLALRLYDLYFRGAPAATAAPTELSQVPGPIAVAPMPTATMPGPAASPSASPSTTVGPQVPLLVGRTFVDAQRQVQPLGVQLRMVEDRSDALPIGYVVSQGVPPGTAVTAGQTVTVTVSVGLGVATAMLPNVIGLPLPEARAQLQRVGVDVDLSQQYNDRFRAGEVVSQVPAPNSPVISGTVVSLVVSNGPSPVVTRPQQLPTATTVRGTPQPEVVRGTIPNLIGQPEAVARRMIDAAGFSNTYTNYQSLDEISSPNREYFLSFAPGTVVSQEPLPGQRLPEGAMVRIAVRQY